MDYGKSKCWVTGHALGEHREVVQTGPSHQRASLALRSLPALYHSIREPQPSE